MDGMIEFNGLLGAVVFLFTAAILVIVFLVMSLSFVIRRKAGKRPTKISKYFLISSAAIIIFDLLFFLMVFVQNDKTWKEGEAEAFDERMFYFWIPAHIGAFFLLPFAIRFVRVRKESIDQTIDKWRK